MPFPSPRACPSPRPAPPLPLPFPFCSPLRSTPGHVAVGGRLRQVRLSLRFNIGENTGFYLIARYPALREEEVRGYLRVRGKQGRKRELGYMYTLVSVVL